MAADAAWWGTGPGPTVRWPGVTIEIDGCGGKYHFDSERADRVCQFFPRFCSHGKGAFAGKPFEPLDYQTQLILRPIFGWVDHEGLRRFRKAYIEVPKKNGKALALDTPIPTPFGWTTMGALQEGDAVFDERGQVCHVQWASPVMHKRDCYRVAFSDGSSLVADAEHQWVTRALTEDGQSKVRTTAQIAASLVTRADGARNHSIELHGSLDLPDVALPIPPYVLGVWLGDGHSDCAAITGSRGDLAILDEVARDGTAVGRVRYRDKRAPDVFHASRLEGLQHQLRLAGLLGAKHIPAVYLRASAQQRMALLQGIMDTDGYCSKRGQCELVTVSERLRDDYLELIRTLGFKPTLKTDRARIAEKDCGDRYRIQFWAFADRPVFRLERKSQRLKARPSRRARSESWQIVACDPVESVPVKCITVDAPSSLYLAGRSMVPTHNTQLVAGLGLYMLLADNEPGAEVYVAAADREQARILFNAAKAMVEAHPALSKRLTVYRNQIVRKDDSSAFFQVLSAEAATKHGPNIHCLIIDELHAQPDRELFETLTRGVIARRQPLILLITTAGDDDESICYEEYEYAKRVLSGTIQDERHLPVIFEAGPKEDWADPKVLERVNPGCGITIKLDALLASALEAKNEPRKRNDHLRYHTNRWVNQATAWIPIEWFDDCVGAIDDAELVTYPCAAGLDLAQKWDLAAFVVAFRQYLASPETLEVTAEEPTGQLVKRSIAINYRLFVRPYFWIPENTMRQHEKDDGVPYSQWAEAGLVTPTEGDIIDYNRIYRDITTQIVPRYPLLKQGSIGYDPAFATDIAIKIREDAGLQALEIPQNYRHLSEPAQVLEALIKGRRLVHDGHRVYRWNWENVAVKTDDAGRIRPVKPKRKSKRIDGVVATLMADKALTLIPEKKEPEFMIFGGQP